MQVVRNLKGALTSLRLVDDSFANDKSILESLKNKQNLIIINSSFGCSINKKKIKKRFVMGCAQWYGLQPCLPENKFSATMPTTHTALRADKT